MTTGKQQILDYATPSYYFPFRVSPPLILAGERLMYEHDTVVLTRSLPDHGLQVGDMGAIVHVYGDQQGFEVEFVSGDGETVAVVTLSPGDVRRLGEREILHARRIPA